VTVVYYGHLSEAVGPTFAGIGTRVILFRAGFQHGDFTISKGTKHGNRLALVVVRGNKKKKKKKALVRRGSTRFGTWKAVGTERKICPNSAQRWAFAVREFDPGSSSIAHLPDSFFFS